MDMDTRIQTHLSQMLASLLLIGACLPLANAQLLRKGFETTYEVYHNGMYLGDSVRKLSPQKQGPWEYRSITQAKGFASLFIKDRVEERSLLSISPTTIKPLSYTYDQTGGKRTQHIRLDYNWDKNTLSNSFLNKELELVPGTQDLLSFLLQIMLELQTNKEIIELYVADKKRVDAYQLKVIGNETIETPYKSLPTIVLLSNKIKGKMQFKIWCAPSLQYLPVRIQKIDNDGDEDTFSLKEFKLPAN